VLGLVSAFFGFMTAIAQEVPQLDQIGRRTPDRIGAIYARDGDKEVRLAELRSSQSRVIVQPNQISTAMKRAIVAIEDERFYEHNGVDPRAIVRAAVRRVRTDAVEGGSTITSSSSRTPTWPRRRARSTPSRASVRKLREALLASQLERIWGKEKILAQYLNTIYFGHGTYGVETAARFYFGKPAAELEVDEAALLAALPKSPTQYDPIAQPRGGSRAPEHRHRQDGRDGVPDGRAGRGDEAAPSAARPTAAVADAGQDPRAALRRLRDRAARQPLRQRGDLRRAV
jgi:membrane peptidoglycan carboxypeptidase